MAGVVVVTRVFSSTMEALVILNRLSRPDSVGECYAFALSCCLTGCGCGSPAWYTILASFEYNSYVISCAAWIDLTRWQQRGITEWHA
jgi:hypothetical protein